MTGEIRVQAPGSGVLFDYASQEERNRSLWLAERRQDLAHRGCLLPSWQALSDAEREVAAVEARNWLRAAAEGGVDLRRPGPAPAPLLVTPRDRRLIVAALGEAACVREERAGSWCDACQAAGAGICDTHADDVDQAEAYRALAERIGGPR